MSEKAINWEQISFTIITEAGEAKSLAMEAIFAAKEKNFELAKTKIAESNKAIAKASHRHFEVIQKEAQGEQLDFKVLFMHAEDQLLTTQTLILLAKEIIDLHKSILSTGKNMEISFQ